MKTKSALKLSFVVAAIAVVSGCSTSSMNSVGRATQGVAQAAQSSYAGIGAAEPQTVKSVRCDEAVKTISLAPLQCKASSCQEQNSNAGNFGALINYAREQEGIPNLVGFIPKFHLTCRILDITITGASTQITPISNDTISQITIMPFIREAHYNGIFYFPSGKAIRPNGSRSINTGVHFYYCFITYNNRPS